MHNALSGFIQFLLFLFQIPIVDDEMKKAAGEVKEDGEFLNFECFHMSGKDIKLEETLKIMFKRSH